MKISNWSLLGYGGGIILLFTSVVRYWWMYSDIDKVLAYSVIGILILAVSWLYNMNMRLNNKINAVEDYLSDKKQDGRRRKN